MNNNAKLIACMLLLIVGLLIVVIDDARQMREMKQLKETLSTVSNVADEALDIANNAYEMASELEKARLETEAKAQSYVYHYNSYYDSDYDDLTDQEYIAQRESGQDYNARNGQYIGKYQLNEMYLDGDYSPENQERTAEQYMLDRYGSWENAREFWDANGWW